MYTPSSQLFASVTSGTVVERLPPKMNASTGTPCGSSQLGSIDGHCAGRHGEARVGMRGGRPARGVHSLPVQSVSFGGGLLRHALPPHVALGRERHVGEDGVALDRSMQFGLVS
jgi:hypothetical protein